jgi:hypothetical protein
MMCEDALGGAFLEHWNFKGWLLYNTMVIVLRAHDKDLLLRVLCLKMRVHKFYASEKRRLKTVFGKESDISRAKVNSNLKSGVLVLVFGMLIILITFGDNRVNPLVGNLDAIFGHYFWRFMDVLYPFASITVFLLYGVVKGGLRVHVLTVSLFLIFLMALSMVIIDDIFIVLDYSIQLPKSYWGIASWVYPFVAASSFLAFGWICARLKGGLSNS